MQPRSKRGDRILSDLNNFYRIRQSFCRIPFNRNPVQILSEFDGTRWNPGRIWSNFIAFRCIPMKSGLDSDRKESNKNSVGSDRFFMKDVGFQWNPTRIRSKTIGSTGRITCPGSEAILLEIALFNLNIERFYCNLSFRHNLSDMNTCKMFCFDFFYYSLSSQVETNGERMRSSVQNAFVTFFVFFIGVITVLN